MKLSQLNYFMTVALLENMSKAAELLHISQSSLSKNIVALENELGTALFDRGCRQLSLNAAGKRVFKSCSLILQEYHTLKNDIHFMTTGSNNRIRIGSCGSIRRIYPCMSQFKSIHPETEYDFYTYTEEDGHPDINEYDVLIYPAELPYEKFTGYSFESERYLLAVPLAHPLVKKAAVSIKMLHGLDYVFLCQGSSLIEYPYKVCQALAIQSSSRSFVNSRELHRQIIASGIAAGFVSENCLDFYTSKNIRTIPLLDHRFSRELKICFRREKHLTDLGRAFRDFSKDYFSLTQIS